MIPKTQKFTTWSFVYNYNTKWLIRAKFKRVLSLLTTLNSCFQVCVFPRRQFSNRHISSDTEQTQYYQYFCESVFLKEKQSENSLLSRQEIICNPKFYLNLLFIEKQSIVQRNKNWINSLSLRDVRIRDNLPSSLLTEFQFCSYSASNYRLYHSSLIHLSRLWSQALVRATVVTKKAKVSGKVYMNSFRGIFSQSWTEIQERNLPVLHFWIPIPMYNVWNCGSHLRTLARTSHECKLTWHALQSGNSEKLDGIIDLLGWSPLEFSVSHFAK